MPTWFRACRVDEIAEARGISLEIDGLRVAVFNDGGAIRALQGLCPHANGPLGKGWIEEGAVVCPLHRWRFRLEDGLCESVAGASVHAFPVEVRDGEVWVEV